MNIKHFLYTLLYICALFSCSHDADDTENKVKTRRTIIAYVCGDNNLNYNLQNDITEMISGSANLPSDCKLIVFADLSNTVPYIYEIQNGQRTTVKKFSEEIYCTDPANMLNAMQWIADNYPAEEYALLMTGHGNGSIIEQDTVETIITRRYAYGSEKRSDGNQEKWLNIPTFASILSQLNDKNGAPLHFDYIFFDCCCMQTAEVAYELRNYTDYIVAAASEVPGKGAPYNIIVPILGYDKEVIGKEIIDKYIKGTQWNGYGGIAISTIKTCEMNNLADATHEALLSIRERKKANNEWSETGIWDGTQWVKDKITLDRENCIYYYREYGLSPILHDMKNVMRINLDADSYEKWLTQFNKTVVYSYCPDGSSMPWQAQFIEFRLFTINEDNYGGMSMIVPNDIYDKDYDNLNSTMYNLEWTNKVGWHELGW